MMDNTSHENYASQENHAMVCERMLENGVDVLYCPSCGRKILIQWTPTVRQVIIEAGDENAVHTAYRVPREPEIPSPDAMPEEPPISPKDAVEGEPARLAQWETWLQAIGFEGWWTRPAS